jgi:membrane associated rhomboid family serine protease
LTDPIRRYHLSLAFTVPPIVKKLLLVHAGAYLFQIVTGHRWDQFFGLMPTMVVSKGALWQLATYVFQHANPMHLLWNMLIMWMFGSDLELYWGPKRFLFYYLLCGIGAGVATVLLTPNTSSVTVGASGANFGLLAAFGLLFPNRPVAFMLIIPMKAKYLVLLLGLLQLLLFAQDAGGGIAYGTHIGGLVTGAIYLLIAFKGSLVTGKKWFRISRARRPRLTVVPTRKGEDASHRGPSSERDDLDQTETDRILDKISALGIDSLTERERRILQKASKTMNKRGGKETD